MIAVDEPREVEIIPKPLTFWVHGNKHQAAVSKTASSPQRFARDYAGCLLVRFEGEFGRAWLADPCSMALRDGLFGQRRQEDAQGYADRMARRRAKQAQAEEAAAARRTKSRRW